MTQQPTAPWTPERAIQCIRDWRSDQMGWHDWLAKYKAEYDASAGTDDVVCQCVEVLAAEIERQRARADKAEAEVRRMSTWYDEIADTIPCDDAGRHYGVVEWHRIVVAEVDRLKAELAALSLAAGMASKQQQQQPEPVAVPSDEEMDRALVRCMDDDQCSPDTYAMLILLARRVGVRL